MFQKEQETMTHTCPTCGAQLTSERGRLRCPEHGAFVAYGPRLVIREPRANGHSAAVAMPWEAETGERRRS